MNRSAWLAAGILALALCIIPAPALAWASLGHQTIGAVADAAIVGTGAAAPVKALLAPGETLASISIWADCVKHPDQPLCAADTSSHKQEWARFAAQVGDTDAATYHFADVDIGSARYVFDPDQRKEDVVHGIRESIAALEGVRSGPQNPHGLTPRQGLWLLTHLVGDIHQPLHVGVIAIHGDPGATRGGNLLFPDATSCLHARWDVAYVDNALQGRGATPAELAAWLKTQHQNDALPAASGNPLDWPAAWATESAQIARDSALKDVRIGPETRGSCGHRDRKPGWSVTLPADYDELAARTAEAQLWKAGRRLARLLEAIKWTSGG